MADTDAAQDRPNRHLPLIGTYERDLPVTLARMFENALDWEHLPHMHADSFENIECIDAGPWGWHCNATLGGMASGQVVELELRLEPERQRWITRTLSGVGAGTEIWSHVYERAGGGLRVIVDFFMPDVPEAGREGVAAYYKTLYAKLYDEDVSMMTGRQAALDAKKSASGKGAETDLGTDDDVRARLPFVFELGDSRFKLVAQADRLLAYSVTCPHLLGPLDEAEIVEGVVRCPWHGYEFDIVTGTCRTGQACQLAPAPTIEINEAGHVIASLPV